MPHVPLRSFGCFRSKSSKSFIGRGFDLKSQFKRPKTNFPKIIFAFDFDWSEVSSGVCKIASLIVTRFVTFHVQLKSLIEFR